MMLPPLTFCIQKKLNAISVYRVILKNRNAFTDKKNNADFLEKNYFNNRKHWEKGQVDFFNGDIREAECKSA
ncbi:Uncharacterized protein dnm_082270 [Desulfonema magnum]|uniref:Uncharacterized protein n=1 Tax=Desulfonema magnum TaxID=45655 RepID=A0A975BUT1_9BACT|nr:Uncharacterized protein dnm_082270 [Desulfonema magnum]